MRMDYEASASSPERMQDESSDVLHPVMMYAPGFEAWVAPCVGVENVVVGRSVSVSPMKKKQNDSGYSEGNCGDFESTEMYNEDQADFSGGTDSDSDVMFIGEVSSSYLTGAADCKRNIPSCLVEAIDDLAVRDSVRAADDRNVGNSVEIIEEAADEDGIQVVDLDSSVEIIDEFSSGRQDNNANDDSVNDANVKDSIEDDPIYGELKCGKI